MSGETTAKRRGRPVGSKNRPKNPELQSTIFSLDQYRELLVQTEYAISLLPERTDVRKFLAKDAPDFVVELVDREQNRLWYEKLDFLNSIRANLEAAISAIESRINQD